MAAPRVMVSGTQRRILARLADHPDGLTCQQLQPMFPPRSAAAVLASSLPALQRRGWIRCDSGKYRWDDVWSITASGRVVM